MNDSTRVVSPLLVSLPRTPQPLIPLAICHSYLNNSETSFVLTIQRLPLSFTTTVQNSYHCLTPALLLSLSQGDLPVSSHISVNFSINPFLLHTCLCHFLPDYFRERNVFHPLLINTCICVSSHPVLWVVEQTALKSDPDLNPHTKILQLLPASSSRIWEMYCDHG